MLGIVEKQKLSMIQSLLQRQEAGVISEEIFKPKQELYPEKNWELWKQNPPSFSRVEAMEACEDRTH